MSTGGNSIFIRVPSIWLVEVCVCVNWRNPRDERLAYDGRCTMSSSAAGSSIKALRLGNRQMPIWSAACQLVEYKWQDLYLVARKSRGSAGSSEEKTRYNMENAGCRVWSQSPNCFIKFRFYLAGKRRPNRTNVNVG
ncbi:hypothetical protein V2G26_011040 [Clonostachys chloroleuca]